MSFAALHVDDGLRGWLLVKKVWFGTRKCRIQLVSTTILIFVYYDRSCLTIYRHQLGLVSHRASHLLRFFSQQFWEGHEFERLNVLTLLGGHAADHVHTRLLDAADLVAWLVVLTV